MSFSVMSSAHAACCIGCQLADCNTANPQITAKHNEMLPKIQEDTSSQFIDHKKWVTEDFLKDTFVPGLQKMAERLSSVGTQQIYRIGTFFDGKQQLETQRLFSELALEAHKDYQPSESFCTFGTAVRSIAHTESAAKATAFALSRKQQSRNLGTQYTGGSTGEKGDKESRWNYFLTNYCDPQDNNWISGVANTGLTSVCGATGGGNTDRINIDIDFTRLIENKRTLNIYGGNWLGADEEKDIIAMGKNLYGNDVLTRNISKTNVADQDLGEKYMQLRSVVAKRSVAENSFNAIVGLKAQGSNVMSGNSSDTNKYLGKILQDLGIPENDVVKYLGLDPSDGFTGNDGANASYYATLEILAKKIYQNPTFYANLYDTPANVKRKTAALKAIELMLDRSIFESQLRQEMAMSVLLTTRLSSEVSGTGNLIRSNE